MIIYLIRHGETTGDIEDRYGGDYDDHLSDKGKQQAEQLAKKLKGKGIQIIYYSSRMRATETVQIVNEVLHVKLEAVDDLRERNNYGILTGMTKRDAKQKYPDEVEELSEGICHNVKGSEDYDSFRKRVIRGFEKIIQNNEYSTCAIISHSGPIRCIFREILRLEEPDHIEDCEIIGLEKKNSKISLLV